MAARYKPEAEPPAGRALEQAQREKEARYPAGDGIAITTFGMEEGRCVRQARHVLAKAMDPPPEHDAHAGGGAAAHSGDGWEKAS
eukprot:3628322-Lingulodinium_polyedra.AAC.1